MKRAVKDNKRARPQAGKTGTVCDLAAMVKLKHKFSYRLLGLTRATVLERLGHPVAGAWSWQPCNWKRTRKYAQFLRNKPPAGLGGVTVGSEEVVDRQRLSGSGYCFSASSPPFTAATAGIQTIGLLHDRPVLLQRVARQRAVRVPAAGRRRFDLARRQRQGRGLVIKANVNFNVTKTYFSDPLNSMDLASLITLIFIIYMKNKAVSFPLAKPTLSSNNRQPYPYTTLEIPIVKK